MTKFCDKFPAVADFENLTSEICYAMNEEI